MTCGSSTSLIRDELDLRFEHVAFTNAVLCLPKGGAGKYPVTSALRDACRPHLVSFIETLAPVVVATLGAKALDAANRVERHGLEKMCNAAGRSVVWQAGGSSRSRIRVTSRGSRESSRCSED